jgi:PKD repeat protein
MDGTTPVAPACSAAFKYYQAAYDSIAGKASVQFNNFSQGDSLSYFWNFNNGTTSTEKEPTIKFDVKPAVYNVCLTVTGKNNCTDIFCEAVTIINPGQPVIIPPMDCQTAFGYQVNYKVQTFAPALVLDFYSKASPDATEWSWNFDDGTTSIEQNPTHLFSYPLVKDSINGDPNPFRKVCLTVKTINGCTASYCSMINIYMDKTLPVDPAPQCHAMFKYYRPTDMVSVPEVIPYKLVDASEGKVVSRLWKFEDGTSSTEAEPLVNFNFMKPTQQVCLTIYTADSCSSSWCETIVVSGKPDTSYISKPDTIIIPRPANIYKMHYISSFPAQMSSCAGYAKAEVFLNDTIIMADKFVWSNGAVGQEVKGLCPTQIYSVKATTIDGTVVSGTFLFNSDGTVTEAPYDWWVSGVNDNPLLRDNLYNQNYTVEWKLCDGTMIRSDSIPRNSMNCGTEEATLILKDASGNVVYSENISLKTMVTSVASVQGKPSIKFFPNPVTDVLNIQYSGSLLNEMQIEIRDITGRSIPIAIGTNQKIYHVEPGQNISLNVTSLPKGIYICKMVSEKKVIGMEKFIK